MPRENFSAQARERLARVESRLDQLVQSSEQSRAELRENCHWQRRCVEIQNGRLNTLERSAEQTRTHLRWMKAAWLTAQGAVLAWLGLK